MTCPTPTPHLTQRWNWTAISSRIDGSVRFERVKAQGGGTPGRGTEFLINSGGVNIPTITRQRCARSAQLQPQLHLVDCGCAVEGHSNTRSFVRASRGGRFNGDRQTFGGKISSTIGALCTERACSAAGTQGCASDGVTPSVDFVKQYELGIKNRGSLGGGPLHARPHAVQGQLQAVDLRTVGHSLPRRRGRLRDRCAVQVLRRRILRHHRTAASPWSATQPGPSRPARAPAPPAHRRRSSARRTCQTLMLHRAGELRFRRDGHARGQCHRPVGDR